MSEEKAKIKAGDDVSHPEHGQLTVHDVTVSGGLWVRKHGETDSQPFHVDGAECEHTNTEQQ